MTAAAEFVCLHLWGVTGQAQGLPPTVVARGANTGRCLNGSDCPRRWGKQKGGVAGGIPPHKGGPKARPPRTAVDSDQKSVVRGDGACAAWGRDLVLA